MVTSLSLSLSFSLFLSFSFSFFGSAKERDLSVYFETFFIGTAELKSFSDVSLNTEIRGGERASDVVTKLINSGGHQTSENIFLKLQAEREKVQTGRV